MERTYLDWAASAPPELDIVQAELHNHATWAANPSSQHSEGRLATEYLDSQRQTIAELLRVRSEELVFTSGGTESCQLPLLALLRSTHRDSRRNTILVSAIEHPAIYNQALILKELGFVVKELPVDQGGFVDLVRLKTLLDDSVVLIAIMAVNNELGCIQDLKAITTAIQDAYIAKPAPFLLCDTVQAAGKLPFNFADPAIHALTISAHKFGGLRGSGVLVLRKAVKPLSVGGGQESGRRSGTENTLGAAVMAKALERRLRSMDTELETARHTMQGLIARLLAIKDAKIIPECRTERPEAYSPYILGACFPGLAGETLQRLLDEQGFAVATGSACSEKQKKRRILEAVKVSEPDARCTIRISTGSATSAESLERFAETVAALYKQYRI